MGREGTRHLGVTSAGFQERLSRRTCRDLDAKARAQGLGTWPGKASCSEKHAATILYLRLVERETVQGFTGFISFLHVLFRLLQYKYFS